MTKQLDEKLMIEVIKNVWQQRVNKVNEELAAFRNGNPSVSPGLKVKRKEDGILFTVVAVGPGRVIVRAPEGDDMVVTAQDFSQKFELD